MGNWDENRLQKQIDAATARAEQAERERDLAEHATGRAMEERDQARAEVERRDGDINELNIKLGMLKLDRERLRLGADVGTTLRVALDRYERHCECDECRESKRKAVEWLDVAEGLK